jgi:hypothetical protein
LRLEQPPSCRTRARRRRIPLALLQASFTRDRVRRSAPAERALRELARACFLRACAERLLDAPGERRARAVRSGCRERRLGERLGERRASVTDGGARAAAGRSPLRAERESRTAPDRGRRHEPVDKPVVRAEEEQIRAAPGELEEQRASLAASRSAQLEQHETIAADLLDARDLGSGELDAETVEERPARSFVSRETAELQVQARGVGMSGEPQPADSWSRSFEGADRLEHQEDVVRGMRLDLADAPGGEQASELAHELADLARREIQRALLSHRNPGPVRASSRTARPCPRTSAAARRPRPRHCRSRA